MIKVTAQDAEPTVEYPCLKISSNKNIVFFIGPDTGVCICGGNQGTSVGDFCDVWVESEFIEYTGKVVLENE